MAVLQDLGKVSVIAKGEWSSGTAYEPLDIVSSNGGAYLSKKAVPAGTALSDTTYWQQITSRGEQGIQGEQGEQGETGETGNGIASIAKTSTSGNVDTYTITYDDGDTTTFEVKNGSVTSVDGLTGDVVLDHKANIDGSYDGMTVGSAQQLLASSGVEDKVPYAYRTSGGSMDIGDREELNEIDGMTVAWNQLARELTSTYWGASSNATVTIADDIATVTATAQGAGLYAKSSVLVTAEANHIYFLAASINAQSAMTVRYGLTNTGVTDFVISDTGKWVECQKLYKPSSTLSNRRINLVDRRPSDFDSWQAKNIMFVDLTAMFGATIADYVYSLEQAQAGAGVAWFRDLFPNSFYAYSAPTLMSVKTSGHKTVGFNAYDPTTGTAKVIGNNAYQITGTYTAISIDGQTITPDSNGIFIPTANGTLTVTGGNDTDTCIHLVWSGTRNGEYEAYVEHTYPLDSSLELRGVPKLDSNNKLYADGDIYAPSGDVTRRYGIVDLGTLTWVMSTVTDHNRFQANNLHALVKVATDNIICSKYLLSATHTANFASDKVIATSGSTQDNGRLWIWDDDYTSAADFKTAMSGVYLVYELATPTTETADPYQQTQVVNDWGTEEFIDSRDIAIPVGHKTTYLPNLRDKLQHLPSLASDDGYYLISQQDNTMSLELFRIPKAPSEDGTYQLKATVTGGTPTYFWEAIV